MLKHALSIFALLIIVCLPALAADRPGTLNVAGSSTRSLLFGVSASAVTATTQVLGLSGAGLSYYITDIFFFNNVATAQTINIISSTTAGNACATSPATVTPNVVFGTVANGQWVMSLQTPLKVTANSALCCKLSTATSASCLISGFTGP